MWSKASSVHVWSRHAYELGAKHRRRLEEKFGIQVIAVNINDRKNDFRRALRKLEDFEIDFVFDYKKSVADKYDVEGIPHMLIIDVDGRVAFQHVGYNESALTGIVEEINSLLIKNNLVKSESSY